MDHFNITQICINCLRGNHTFKVELSLYDANGKLKKGVDKMQRFTFECSFCLRKTALDFYSFSHPSMISHLMYLRDQNVRRKDALQNLNNTFN